MQILLWGVVSIAVTFIYVTSSSGEVFECGFTQEKFPNGKPNIASCSMLPEKVYSTKWDMPKNYEHCKVEPVYLYEDLEDVIINTEKRTVTWTKHTGVTQEAIQEFKKHYIKEGASEKEAENKVNNIEKKETEKFKIVFHHKSSQSIFFDEITKKLYDPPKKVPQHTFIISDNYNIFYIYLPESSGHTILLKPDGMADDSWVKMQFGRCRKLK